MSGCGSAKGRADGSEPGVRPARRTDLAAVVEIEAAAFPDPWSARSFADLMARPDAALLVAAAAGEVAGYATLTLRGAEAELTSVAVSPGRRGRGVGAALVGGGVEWARGRGAGRILLAVRTGNAPAIRLYEGAGFRLAGVHPGYYEDPPGDAAIFVLELAD